MKEYSIRWLYNLNNFIIRSLKTLDFQLSTIYSMVHKKLRHSAQKSIHNWKEVNMMEISSIELKMMEVKTRGSQEPV
jgi:sporulation-control protein spo0M